LYENSDELTSRGQRTTQPGGRKTPPQSEDLKSLFKPAPTGELIFGQISGKN
jgi:hypothetical protein